jgi:hypothetical protein
MGQIPLDDDFEIFGVRILPGDIQNIRFVYLSLYLSAIGAILIGGLASWFY